MISLPIGSNLFCVQVQKGEPHLWVLVNPAETIEEIITIGIFGTGHPINDFKRYIGTYQLLSGDFVGHVFIL